MALYSGRVAYFGIVEGLNRLNRTSQEIHDVNYLVNKYAS